MSSTQNTSLQPSKRNYWVDVFAILFGISSWISINGLWVELPLLVQTLPESWTLASYLSIIIQIANIGPILYTALITWQRLTNKVQFSTTRCITTLLILGVTASVLLSLFWNVTYPVVSIFDSSYDHAHNSIVLLGLVFLLSLVDCTSSVLFLPFMFMFQEKYLNSYLIGEGMSGLLPAMVALVQGVGGSPKCQNVTKISIDELTGLESVSIVGEAVAAEPRFSVEYFWYFLTVMMVLSFLAFLVLSSNLRFIRREHTISERMKTSNDSRSDVSPATQSSNMTSSTQLSLNEKDSQFHENLVDMVGDRLNSSSPSTKLSTNPKSDYYSLLAIQMYVCFLSNGLLPSIQTYSCLPFGNLVYHLSVTLYAVANPAVAFLAVYFPSKRFSTITVWTGVGSIFVVHIFITSLSSPNMFLGPYVGGSITVLSWVLFSALFSYVKVSVAGVCRCRSKSALFWCGAVTQIGSGAGALVGFILVNKANFFQQYYVQC